jgi:hypothetical protein
MSNQMTEEEIRKKRFLIPCLRGDRHLSKKGDMKMGSIHGA